MSPSLLTAAPQLNLEVFPTRAAMGHAAATAIASRIHALMERQQTVRMIFAAAPSQAEMLTSLRSMEIDWTRVEAFHMDEYLDLPADAPQRFGLWLRRHFFDLVPLRDVHLLEPEGNAIAAAKKYAALLNAAPVDIVCCGIGSNGHLAFNDPPADFNDRETTKIVKLDQMCRQQQVDDGCFATIEEVPTHALTVTIPALLGARSVFCCIPGEHKRHAVEAMVSGPISNLCPASILRTHPDCAIFLDNEAAQDIRS